MGSKFRSLHPDYTTVGREWLSEQTHKLPLSINFMIIQDNR